MSATKRLCRGFVMKICRRNSRWSKIGASNNSSKNSTNTKSNLSCKDNAKNVFCKDSWGVWPRDEKTLNLIYYKNHKTRCRPPSSQGITPCPVFTHIKTVVAPNCTVAALLRRIEATGHRRIMIGCNKTLRKEIRTGLNACRELDTKFINSSRP